MPDPCGAQIHAQVDLYCGSPFGDGMLLCRACADVTEGAVAIAMDAETLASLRWVAKAAQAEVAKTCPKCSGDLSRPRHHADERSCVRNGYRRTMVREHLHWRCRCGFDEPVPCEGS